MSALNDPYLKSLARELRLRSVSETDIKQEILCVLELSEHGIDLSGELGSPGDYVETLYPNRRRKEFYLFTAIGIFLAVIGFVTLHLLYSNGNGPDLVTLVRYIPLVFIPIGMLIDVTRFSKF